MNYIHLYTDTVMKYEMIYFYEERGPEAEASWAHGSHDVAESHCHIEQQGTWVLESVPILLLGQDSRFPRLRSHPDHGGTGGAHPAGCWESDRRQMHEKRVAQCLARAIIVIDPFI